MIENEPAVVVKNLYKTFKLPNEQHNGIKQLVISFLKRKKGYTTQEVLNDISFTIKKGEFFGIVGRNGSGKSTLLKLLAGIYAPDRGLVEVNGSLTPFIELGVGFNPELTGRENVFMNGALLGLSHKEVLSIYDDIVSFAELEKSMDQKLKNYSSGMQVRLAFSIAIRAESEILLFDEVLAVGDTAFQQKCYEMFAEMKRAGRTIILVTHDMSAVQRFCERAIIIEKGKIVLEGNPSSVADKYLEQNYEVKPVVKKGDQRIAEKNYTVTGVQFKDNKKSFDIGESITTQLTVKNSQPSEKFHIGFQIFNSDGVYVFGTNSRNAGHDPFNGEVVNLEISVDQELGPGTYNISLAVMDSSETDKVLRYIPKVVSFNIKQSTTSQGIVALKSEWREV